MFYKFLVSMNPLHFDILFVGKYVLT